ncbi:uncharacterized protein EURHEDRAFT_196255 [Aspergillus ruber CBS 135680]|uniref:Uncharacterized protein n=1 Tax=Aspergillus ruber (strain CBS 135680) TaxID=1388766 RepID=A0A017S6H3_ASPRC|nr:uncharacterized protein EURHEDRAFT_196255 [Aspergillus ruber CBS 135680]EYE92456.1 hypothetical protein EURHEDRAFT_196255 [Aspergillus ruber CBS 135680]
MPVVLCPLAGIFQYYQWVAEVRGVYKRLTRSGRSPAQSIVYYMQKFALVGNIILKAAFGFSCYRSPWTPMAKSCMLPRCSSSLLLLEVSFSVYIGLWQRYGTQMSCSTPEP